VTALLDRPRTVGVAQPLLRAPHPMLTTACTPVDPGDPATVRLAADLVATMRALPGCVGLAAPQVGRPDRIVVAEVDELVVLCNARVIEARHWQPGREGCVSVPGLAGDLRRAYRLVVAGELPGTGEAVELVTEGRLARVLQHQLDHCAGLLFLDRVRGARAVRPVRCGTAAR